MSSAQAAQNTQVHPIGYSEQGRYFSYEEYGLDAQSCISYSTIFIIDLIQISHVVGTPITYEANIAGQSLLSIRNQALMTAQMFLNSIQVTQPTTIAMMIGDGQKDMDKTELEFGIPIQDASEITGRHINGRYTINLETFEATSTIQCDQYGQTPPLGFALKLSNFGAGIEVYRDKVLARSRNCPFHYELVAIVLPYGATDIADSVGLISVDTNGPRGTGRHFLAIPLAFDIAGNN
jgi:hypothetical protein